MPIPLLLYHGLGLSQTAVNLIVAGLIGGPHLYSTFTYTFMEPSYRRRHGRFLAASLALPVIVTTMAFVNLQVLLTIFFMWASIHVLHQITYINDCYVAKGPRAAAPARAGRRLRRRVPVPVSDGDAADPRRLVPARGDRAVRAAVGLARPRRRRADRRRRRCCSASFFVLWVAKSIRDWRRGTLLVPSVLLIALTIAIGFTLPLFPNIDVAFQGFNVWHSVQYLGLVWYLMAMRKERGEIDNRFVAECNGPDRPWQFYGLAVLLTAVAGMLVLVLHGVFGVDLQKAYYIVILSTLLQHYYLDHLQFTKLGDMLGSGDRLLAGRP